MGATTENPSFEVILLWFQDAEHLPYYILRRMIRFACEDIGIADPGALTIALNVSESFRTLGHQRQIINFMVMTWDGILLI